MTRAAFTNPLPLYGDAGTIAAMKFPILSCATILTLALGALNAVYAGSATWNNNPTSGDWNNAANWMPATVPNGAHNIATFDVSNVTDVSVQASDILKGMTFHPHASPFTISIGSVEVGSLTLGSAGIVNNSGTTQNLLIAGLSTDLGESNVYRHRHSGQRNGNHK